MNHTKRYKQPGQSLPILALMIVVIVGLIGLSVDVGNAYAEQRRVQSAANAAALTGMHAVMGNNTNAGVWQQVRNTMSANRVPVDDPNYYYRVDYVYSDGNVKMMAEWRGGQASWNLNSNDLPSVNNQNVERVEVYMQENVNTYFARVVGRDQLGVDADGVACLGDYGAGVYPLGVPNVLVSPQHKVFSRYTSATSNTQLATTDPRFGKWIGDQTMKNMVVRIPVDNNQFTSGVHAAWLNWYGDDQTGPDGKQYQSLANNNSNSNLAEAWTAPGTLQNGFLEGKSGSTTTLPNQLPMRKLQRLDWIAGFPGMRAGLERQIGVLRDNQTEVMLPIYDNYSSQPPNKMSFRMVNMGRFKIMAVELTGSTRYFDLLYLGTASGAPKQCGSEGNELPGTPNDPNPPSYSIAGTVNLNRVWREVTRPNNVTRDIVVVMDASGSMDYDWNDRRSGQSGYSAQNARVNDARKVIEKFVEDYDITAATGDPDARMSFVTFQGAANQGGLSINTRVGWTQACATTGSVKISNNCGNNVDNKWAGIQSAARTFDTDGYTPGPLAFERAEQLFQSRRQPPAGKTYEQILVFATDGVFNVCGNTSGTNPCTPNNLVPFDGTLGNNQEAYQNNPGYNMQHGRPIWQAQQVATRLKNNGVKTFVVAMTPTCLQGSTTCFSPQGLPDMSSGPGYYYRANDGGALTNIYAQISSVIANETCKPLETWEKLSGATVVLRKPDNPNWSVSTTTNSTGGFQIDNLPQGQYIATVNPMTVRSPEDEPQPLRRTYSRVRNARNLAEEGQASIFITGRLADGATVYSDIDLMLPRNADGTPLNGCTTGTP